ncbi:hypothetical protein PF005_g5588 [Phytophthora fragariae]|uniref:Uncharacterized protein n=1 Tax=Phytophthora fragariae TaxID=53985 RepID=A0A6A3STV0_9STRA|nr:hypothetical protein PF003_g4165 [Phytophthora fragariae]KAE8935150.1 hypothetical protein PF009_g14893 [Phytophthora fragariae]KAE9123232.1 hypothetical protein PF007_g7136 [Phytophthora fragariae]KAE9125784.1 hypothetical protein PF010_g5499 [Phytophthora fragariae]KAE9150766.1 hypothetical protein PF006_g4878 [Phytophthora fragariae]
MATRNVGAKYVLAGAMCSVTAPNPRNVREAMCDELADAWKVAMEEEIGALESNQTWELVKKPDRIKGAALQVGVQYQEACGRIGRALQGSYRCVRQ